MSYRLKLNVKWTVFAFLLGSTQANAQLLQDSTAFHLVKEDIDYIYNQQFTKAQELYPEITRLYPNHPIVYLLRGMLTYWENYPMLHTSPVHISFEQDMHECITLSEANNDPHYEAEYLLANLCARGMLLTFYSDNDLIMEVTPLTISTYKYLRRAFKFARECTDLYYFTGIYKYYREAYPKAYPVYRSLAFLFPHGNMEEGLKELHKAATNSLVLRAESCYLLTWIYMNFENKFPECLYYSKLLDEMYPQNELYIETHIRNLLLMKKYDEAEKLILPISEEGGNKFYQAQLLILKGILREKKYHDNKIAQEYYNKGINEISLFGRYGNEFAAYAYYGLSRISEANGEKQTRKIYRREANKLADFKKYNFDK